MAAIRRATAADVSALHRLIEGAYRGDSAKRGWTHEADLLDGQRTDEAALAQMIADPAERMLLAEEAGAPIGCVAVRRLDGDGAYLGLLTVDPRRQAGGLGRLLLEAAEADARARGASRMEMTVIERRAELVAWYERRGYRVTGERRPFPYDNARFGLPRASDLDFAVLERALGAGTGA